MARFLMISFLHKEANTSAVLLSIFGFLAQHLPSFLTPCIHTHTHHRDNCLGLKKLDEEGRAMFSQYAKTLLDALQTLLNAIR